MGKHVEEAEEEEVAPFWVISFSDMMTLLLTFFIMLFTMSSIETEKFKATAEAFARQFGPKGAAEPPKGQERRPSRKSGFAGGSDDSDATSKERPTSLPRILAEEEAVKGGIVLFNVGSDELTDATKAGLAEIRNQLIGTPFRILIKGHAGVSEQDTRNVDDLAYGRAWNVREYLISLGLKRSFFQLGVVGSSEALEQSLIQRPLEPNERHAYVNIAILLNSRRDE